VSFSGRSELGAGKDLPIRQFFMGKMDIDSLESSCIVIRPFHFVDFVDLVEPNAVSSDRVEHLLGDDSHPVELFAIVGGSAVQIVM
jgi:hypothetical protein